MRILNGIVCYKDHQRVNALIKHLKDEGWGDILVVDNSVDVLAPLNANTLVSDTNDGSSGGFKRLMKEALHRNYDFIVLHDSDGFPLTKPKFSSLSTNRVYNAFVNSAENRANKVSNRSIVFGPVMMYDPHGFFKVVGPSSGKIIPIKIIKTLGLYDSDNYFVNLEDYDFDLRCHRSNIVVNRLKHYLYIHPNHSNHQSISERVGISIFNISLPKSISSERDHRMVHSAVYFCNEYFGWPSRLLVFIISVCRAISRGQLKALRSYLPLLKEVLK